MLKPASSKPRGAAAIPAITVVLIVSALLFSACGGKKAETEPQVTGAAKEIFEKAKGLIKKDPDRSRLLFKEVMHLYPDSLYAQRSKIGIADSYFKQKDAASMVMAANEYQEYVNMFPNSPDAVYAKYQIALCYFNQMLKPGRDQENTEMAIKALDSMIKMYPDTPEAEDAKKKMELARQSMAKHIYLIGVANYRIGALKGAVNRFKQVMDNYPDFKDNDALFYYVGRSYFKMWEYDSALSFFQQVITNYPQSKYFKKCQSLYEEAVKLKAVADGAKKQE